jgi:hypothetical protein
MAGEMANYKSVDAVVMPVSEAMYEGSSGSVPN